MKFNRINIIVLASFIILGAAFINAGFYYAEAQTPNIEKYTLEDKDKKFYRIEFEFYVRASNIGDGNTFLNQIEGERIKHILKDKAFKNEFNLWCDDEILGEIYVLHGWYVFKERTSAQQVRTYFENNVPLDKFDYGQVWLLDNNHHWDRPTADKIIQHKTFGNENQFNTILLRCFSP